MRWWFRSDRERLEAGELARRQHSAWLTSAMASGAKYPRIPTRPVERGGFSALLRRENGPKLAERWWNLALGRIDDAETDD